MRENAKREHPVKFSFALGEYSGMHPPKNPVLILLDLNPPSIEPALKDIARQGALLIFFLMEITL
jgi:hypothetical protein